jgi:hypothetical protein
MRTSVLIGLAGLTFSLVMIGAAKPFPRGVVNELTTARDIYRFARVDQLDWGPSLSTPVLPALILAYAGEGGDALRAALEPLAAQVPKGLFVAMNLETVLPEVPASAFRKSPLPELADGGMETIALVFNRQGERRRWTTAAGPESQALLDDPTAQAQALVAFMQT